MQDMPTEVYRTVRKDTFTPLGELVTLDRIVTDKKYPNKIHSTVRFSKLGLRITFVFHGGEIDGLWFGYYDANERKC